MKADFVRQADAVKKLGGSIIFYDGNPVYVHPEMMADGQSLMLQRLPGIKKNKAVPEFCDFNDPMLDLRSGELGYVNTENAAFYLTRVPHRRDIQGLAQENIVSKPHWRGGRFQNCLGFTKCLLNDYPSIPVALEALEREDAESHAFHKHFALELGAGHVYLLYKGEVVGNYVAKGHKFVLLSSNSASFIGQIIRKANLGIEIQY